MVKVPVEVTVKVASSCLLFASFVLYSFSSKRVLDYASSQHGTSRYWFIKIQHFLLGKLARLVILVYIYVRTFLIRVRVLVICDRNSIARKREEFPILVAEVASSRLHFASRARLLQLLQQTILHYASSQCGTQYNYY